MVAGELGDEFQGVEGRGEPGGFLFGGFAGFALEGVVVEPAGFGEGFFEEAVVDEGAGESEAAGGVVGAGVFTGEREPGGFFTSAVRMRSGFSQLIQESPGVPSAWTQTRVGTWEIL